MDSMYSKLERKKSLPTGKRKANREVVTTPLFKLYQTNRPSENGYQRLNFA
jgi:hypothetical protein